MQIRAAVDPHLLDLPLTLLSAAVDNLSILSAADQVARTSAHAHTSPVLDGMTLLFVVAMGPAIMGMFTKGNLAEDEPEPSGFTDVPNTVQPGWLTCDMRVPLPAYPDLEKACHLINTING